MKKSLILACLVGAFAVSSFAQSASEMTPAEAGAKRVAERDAEWLRAHSGGAEAKEPMAPRKAKHVKKAKHPKQPKHKVKKGAMSNADAAKPQ